MLRKKLLLTLATLLTITTQVQADYGAGLTVKQIAVFNDGAYHINFDKPFNNKTCSHLGFRFRVEPSAGSDKIYNQLMLAYLLGKKVNIGFSTSGAIGTDHNSGCNLDKMSKIHYVFFN